VAGPVLEHRRQAAENSVPSSDRAIPVTVVDLNQRNSNGKSIPQPAPPANHKVPEISAEKDPPQRMEIAASTQTTVTTGRPRDRSIWRGDGSKLKLGIELTEFRAVIVARAGCCSIPSFVSDAIPKGSKFL
jgi:hypothetical protein